MVQKLQIEEFLERSASHVTVDVRAPKEFNHAHIPGALSLPLFSDEERAEIGTLYKKEGREKAMTLGLEYYGKDMQRILSDLKNHTPDKELFIHCWRGGMRSGVVSWMLDLFGYRVFVLVGGYQSFRREVINSFSREKNLLILGGKTGVAKTETLRLLIQEEEQVIDLENIASHKGSAFGDLGMGIQPGQEQFENDLFFAFRKMADEKYTWLEDESQRIGLVNLPNALWDQMRNAQVIYVDIPFEERLNYLVKVYGDFPVPDLIRGVERIQKRLGGVNAKNAMDHLQKLQVKEAFEILLHYYDRYYEKASEQRDLKKIKFVHCQKVDPESNAAKLLELVRENYFDPKAENSVHAGRLTEN